mmetsp:Transcript_47109/g.75479  ORF Transcript_47109/g.75479 Transcript_47109/m.75479 type:complete len:94 (-) Transcript_47109:32-313(-)
MPGGVHPRYLGQTPHLRQLFRPFYPINFFWRFAPAVGLFTVAAVFHYNVPEYERLYEKLEKNAFTYEHPLEIQKRLKQEAEKAAAAGGDEDDD